MGHVTLDKERVVAVRRADAVFKRPVHIGDTVHVELKVLDHRPLDGEFSIVRCLWKIVNQRGRVVTKVTVDLLWREEGEHQEVTSTDWVTQPTSEGAA